MNNLNQYNNMDFNGKITKVFPIQTGTSKTGNEWKRQDFIVEYYEHPTDRWADKVMLSVMNARVDESDLHEGDEVKVGFSHNVREYNGRYYNELHCYRVEKISATAAQEPAAPAAEAPVKNDEEPPF